MKVETWMILLLTRTIFLTGVTPRAPQDVLVKAGEMVTLNCPAVRGRSHGDGTTTWTRHGARELDVRKASAKRSCREVLLHLQSMVILKASLEHQGIYSCSLGNSMRRSWFQLIVYATPSKEVQEHTSYFMTCTSGEPCTLTCPDVKVPAVSMQNLSNGGTTCRKVGDPSTRVENYFSRVQEKHRGVYTCVRFYLYADRTYHMTFGVVLDVRIGRQDAALTPPPQVKGDNVQPRDAEIIRPRDNDTFQVDLGSRVKIPCVAVTRSDFDEVFWLRGNTFVETNDSSPVFYTFTQENHGGEIKMTATLVFQKVSEEDLSTGYTCKLESISQTSTFVTIKLESKGDASPVWVPPALAERKAGSIVVETRGQKEVGPLWSAPAPAPQRHVTRGASVSSAFWRLLQDHLPELHL